MSNHSEEVREVLGQIIIANCIDCFFTFKGTVGLRFIETPEGPGVEVCVCSGGTAHAIARVQKHLIPTVQVKAA